MPEGLWPSGITSLLCQYLAYGTRGHVITITYSNADNDFIQVHISDLHV